MIPKETTEFDPHTLLMRDKRTDLPPHWFLPRSLRLPSIEVTVVVSSYNTPNPVRVLLAATSPILKARPKLTPALFPQLARINGKPIQIATVVLAVAPLYLQSPTLAIQRAAPASIVHLDLPVLPRSGTKALSFPSVPPKSRWTGSLTMATALFQGFVQSSPLPNFTNTNSLTGFCHPLPSRAQAHWPAPSHLQRRPL